MGTTVYSQLGWKTLKLFSERAALVQCVSFCMILWIFYFIYFLLYRFELKEYIHVLCMHTCTHPLSCADYYILPLLFRSERLALNIGR